MIDQTEARTVAAEMERIFGAKPTNPPRPQRARALGSPRRGRFALGAIAAATLATLLASIRSGRPRSRLVDGELVYAIGDVHGRYDLFSQLLETIAADARERADGRRPLLVLLGDYVDRGPDSARVLSALTWLAGCEECEVRLLKGNHEESMLAYLDAAEHARNWLRFGGDATMRSYGVEPPTFDAPIEDHRRASRLLLDAMPASHLALLHRLELSVELGDYAFVHAGVRPGVALHRQVAEDLLWIRDDFVGRDHRFARIIVHGHTWTRDEPERREHRIAIDTGAYATGVLTAVRIEDDAIAFLHARGDAPSGSDEPLGAETAAT